MTDQPGSPDLAGLVTRLRAAGTEVLALRSAVEVGEPWPLSDHFGVEPEARWGPSETLAHLAEMLPFWTGEVERVLAGRAGPTPFGRVASNDLRIGIIERDRTLPARELFARVESGVGRLAGRLEELDVAAAGRLGRHPTLGDMPVAAIVARFVVDHLEEHAVQLRAVLGSG